MYKKRGLHTSSTFLRYRQTPLQSYTSKSPRRGVSVLLLLLIVLSNLAIFKNKNRSKRYLILNILL